MVGKTTPNLATIVVECSLDWKSHSPLSELRPFWLQHWCPLRVRPPWRRRDTLQGQEDRRLLSDDVLHCPKAGLVMDLPQACVLQEGYSCFQRGFHSNDWKTPFGGQRCSHPKLEFASSSHWESFESQGCTCTNSSSRRKQCGGSPLRSTQCVEL